MSSTLRKEIRKRVKSDLRVFFGLTALGMTEDDDVRNWLKKHGAKDTGTPMSRDLIWRKLMKRIVP